MTLDLQYKIKNNPMYQNYLRENSYWYKILNRTPEQFKEFENKAKERYQVRTTDNINKILNAFEMVNSIVSSLK